MDSSGGLTEESYMMLAQQVSDHVKGPCTRKVIQADKFLTELCDLNQTDRVHDR